MTHNQFKKWFESNGFEVKITYLDDRDSDVCYNGEPKFLLNKATLLFSNGAFRGFYLELCKAISKTDDYLTFHFADRSEYKVWLGEVE